MQLCSYICPIFLKMEDEKDIFGIENNLSPYIGKCAMGISRFITSELKRRNFGLSYKQVVVLKILRQSGPLPQNDLAFITNRDKATLVRFINTLEKKNMVLRKPCHDDKRVNRVMITEKGLKVLNSVTPIFKELLNQLQEGVSLEEKHCVMKVTQKIMNNIQALEVKYQES